MIGIPGEQLLEKALTTATEKSGYRRKFHAGARVPSAKAKGSPSPFVKSYAYTAVPIAPGESGARGFCGDNQGRDLRDRGRRGAARHRRARAPPPARS